MQNSIPKIRGYAIYLRHGHRSPSANIMTDVGYDEERSLWKRHVNEANTLRTALDDSFPSWMDRWMMNYAAPNDPNHPHGWMTMRGLQHVGQVGCKIAASFPLIASIPNENINVYSTRYERTKVRLNQPSQCFMQRVSKIGGSSFLSKGSGHRSAFDGPIVRFTD